MAVYTNDLRLKEIATGDESGTWGTSTNTNLSLIADAFSFGTEAITTNADTHTTTIADGAADPGRSIFLKYTGTLDSACTITIGPNTVSKLWLIENATSGSQNIIIKQGSGATVTIANGQTKAIYSDGAGSGGAMVDAFQDLSIPDLFIDDDLTFTSDSAVITFGADGDTTLTHTDGSGLTLNSTNKLMFNDASQFIQGSSATVLSLGATDEIDLTATAIDVNGTMDVSGALTGTTATFTTADNTAQVALVSTDADAADGPILEMFRNSSSPADDDDLGIIKFFGENDASEKIEYGIIEVKAVDVSDGTEDGSINITAMLNGTARSRLFSNSTETVFNEGSQDLDFRVESNGNANMLFVDGGNDRVGVGVSDPQTELFVRKDTGGSPTRIGISNSGTVGSGTASRLSFYEGNTESSFIERRRDGTGDTAIVTPAADNPVNIEVNGGNELASFTGSAIIFNEDSGDQDFRVESNGNANMLVVDAGNDRVGVGTASPADVLEVQGSIDGSVSVVVQNNSSGTSAYAGLKLDGDGNNFFIKNWGDNVSGLANATQFISTAGSSFFIFSPNSTEAMRMDASGGVTVNNGQDANINFIAKAGSSSNALQVDGSSGAVTINEASADADFRVESDSNTNAIFMNAGTGVTSFGHGNVMTGNTYNFQAAALNGFAVGSSNAVYATVNQGGQDGDLLLVSNAFPANLGATRNVIIQGGTSGGSSPKETARFNPEEGVIFNESSIAAHDFRVESDNNTHMLFLDSGNDRVQIGSDSATFNGNTAGNFVVLGGSTGSSNPVAIIADPDGSVEGGSCILELSFTGDTSFSNARMMQFRDLEATQGTIECSGTGTVTYNTSSDERLKEDIQDTSSKWEDLKAIKVRDYKWKKSGVLDTGFVAQELNEHWPNAVSEGKEDEFLDPWTVDYGRLTPILTKALQEAMEKIEALEQEVAKLKGE